MNETKEKDGEGRHKQTKNKKTLPQLKKIDKIKWMHDGE